MDIQSPFIHGQVTLLGCHVRLEPLDLQHSSQLTAAVQDGGLWRLWYTSIPCPDEMELEIERRLGLLALGSMVPFTIFDLQTDRAVGMTTYTAIDCKNRRVEIGHTWLAKSAHRTPINTEAKLLLLAHAFETLGTIAVELRTHFMNRRSRQAIDRLGAKLDGILRSHILQADGVIRDTCVYSILLHEWPGLRANLEHRLGLR